MSVNTDEDSSCHTLSDSRGRDKECTGKLRRFQSRLRSLINLCLDQHDSDNIILSRVCSNDTTKGPLGSEDDILLEGVTSYENSLGRECERVLQETLQAEAQEKERLLLLRQQEVQQLHQQQQLQQQQQPLPPPPPPPRRRRNNRRRGGAGNLHGQYNIISLNRL